MGRACRVPALRPASPGIRGQGLKRAVTGLAVALLMSTAALALTFLLDPLVHQSVLVLFLGAATLSAWFGGLGPGLVASALGGLAFSFFLTEPVYSLVVSESGIATDLAIFSMVSLLINGLYVRLRHVQRREQAARCAAEEAVRLRDSFLAAAAHDLSNPLTAILGICQLLNRRLGYSQGHDSERCSDAIVGIESNARRLAAQIEQLLDVACTEAGRPLGLRRIPTDLVALVDRVIAARSQSSLRHDLRLETQLEQLLGVYDPVRLERVVDNLLANALKYSPLGGKIVVRLERERTPRGAWAVLAVLDEGLGVPAADLPLIFEPFRRAGNVGPISGTGIGLASARQIVEEHGGRVTVTSREGAGSTFTVYLPVGSDVAGAGVASEAPSEPRLVGRGRTH